MHIAPQPISQHRLQRAHRWAMLWLSWFAAFLHVAASYEPISKLAHQLAHRRLYKIEKLIVSLIVLHALPRLRRGAQRKAKFDHRRLPPSFLRAVLGSRLRRMLRSRDLHQRIAALRHDIHDLVARVLKRLPRGLTRRRPIKASNWTAGAPAGIFPCALTYAGDPVADTS